MAALMNVEVIPDRQAGNRTTGSNIEARIKQENVTYLLCIGSLKESA